MSNGRNEQLNPLIEKVQDEKIKSYINVRVLPQMEYYSKQSGKCKKMFQRWSTVAIVIGALIPVFAIVADGNIIFKIVLALLGSSVTAINACLNLYNYQSLWSNYRYCREALLSILLQYFTHTGAFSEEDEDKRNKSLVEACEAVFNEEKKDWKQVAENANKN